MPVPNKTETSLLEEIYFSSYHMIWFTCIMTIIQPILGQQPPLTMHKK